MVARVLLWLCWWLLKYCYVVAIGLLLASRVVIGHLYAFAQELWVVARALLSGYFGIVGGF